MWGDNDESSDLLNNNLQIMIIDNIIMDSSSIGECYIVSGLQYGDEGKGTIVDYLVREKEAGLVVRYGGGPQAAHHVVRPDGTWHCFSHYGSGMFWEESRTVLSKYMIVYPQTLERETQILQSKTKDPVGRLYIDHDCYILTPYHQMISRVFEILRSKKKGSTGLGVGQVAEQVYKNPKANFPKSQHYHKTQTLSLQIKDLLNQNQLKQKLTKIMESKKQLAMSIHNLPIDEVYQILYSHIAFEQKQKEKISFETQKLVVGEVLNFIGPNSPDNIQNTLEFYKEFRAKYKACFVDTSIVMKQHLLGNKKIVFEGSQGALLDLIYGFYPHTTKTICTTDNVQAILEDINLSPKVTKVGVLRCYSHRHGEGPFIPFDDDLTEKIPELHNRYSKWQGNFKIGYLDGIALRYGIQVFQPDILAVTNIDRIKEIKECHSNVCIGYSINLSQLTQHQKEILTRRFEYTVSQSTITITRIKKVTQKESFKNYQLTLILNKCSPIYQSLPSQSTHPLDPVLSTRQYIIPLLRYIEQIGEKQIHIISESPTCQGKNLLRDNKKYQFG